MSNKLYSQVKDRIEFADAGTVFLTKDFADIADITTIRQYLGRQVNDGKIRRIMNGIYEKPRYSRLLQKNISANPDKVASAIARNYHWTIAPSGNTALNRLGLSTQVPAQMIYISDGPYREFQWDNYKIKFKHRANRDISNMSLITAMVIEAIKTLGKENVTDETVSKLKNTLSREDKQVVLSEAYGANSWIYEILKKVCEKC